MTDSSVVTYNIAEPIDDVIFIRPFSVLYLLGFLSGMSILFILSAVRIIPLYIVSALLLFIISLRKFPKRSVVKIRYGKKVCAICGYPELSLFWDREQVCRTKCFRIKHRMSLLLYGMILFGVSSMFILLWGGEGSERKDILFIIGTTGAYLISIFASYLGFYYDSTDLRSDTRSANEKKLLRTVEKLNKKPTNVDALMKKGRILRDMNRYEESLSTYEKALRIQPENGILWNNMAVTHYVQRSFTDALRCYDRAIEIDPKLVMAWRNRASALEGLERYEESLIAYQKALELDPKLTDLLMKIGLIYEKLHQFDLAEKTYDNILDKDNRNFLALHNKAIALQYAGKYEEAVDNYRVSLRINPKNVNGWYNLTRIHMAMDRIEEAVSDLNYGLKIDPTNVAIWFTKAEVMEDIPDYEKAVEYYTKVIELNPQHIAAWMSKIACQRSLKNFQECLITLDELLQVFPTFSTAWNNKGFILNLLDQYDEAIQAYDKALELENNSNTLLNKAVALRNLGKFHTALHTVEQVLDSEPTNEVAMQEKQELVEIINALV
ncbi:MAG: tetratricopeptide repeat protein [Candidatus Kariarchaeaceae archaeon]|jgi:superkiller protein 3